MAKHGKLKDITVKEVSLVDLPANKLPFLFFKRQGTKDSDSVSKAKKIKIAIESDSTVGGTAITINGKKLSKLKSFDFSFYGGGDPKQRIHASYTKGSDDSDGFSRTETYYLSKGDIMDKKTKKALEKYLGTDDIDFEKQATEEDIAKALQLVTEHYQESFPEDLEKAVGVLAKSAAIKAEVKEEHDDVEKAGAKFSKDVLEKLRGVVEAVEALKGVLPEASSTKKSDGTDNELVKRIEELSKVVGALEGNTKEEKKEDTSDLAKTLYSISKRLETIEKSGACKKSIDGDDSDGDDNDNGDVKWPSLVDAG